MATSLSFKELKVSKKETEVTRVTALSDSSPKNNAMGIQMKPDTRFIMDYRVGNLRKLLMQISNIGSTLRLSITAPGLNSLKKSDHLIIKCLTLNLPD
jgi:hypothetical protein